MPGLVLFKRRWSIGSDDIVVPAIMLFCCHLVQSAIMLSVLLVYQPGGTTGSVSQDGSLNKSLFSYGSVLHLPSTNWTYYLDRGVLESEFYDTKNSWLRIVNTCHFSAKIYTIIYLVLLLACLIVEFACARFSLRGGILAVERRWLVQYLLYGRLGLFLLEIIWLIFGVVVLVKLRFFVVCPGRYSPIRVMTVVVAVNWSVTLLVLLTVWCVFDRAGRSWVKTRHFQQQEQQRKQLLSRRRGAGGGGSGVDKRRTGSSRRRNLKHRQALMQYEQIWDRRFRRIFCCLPEAEDGAAEGAFADVARLFSDFFRDLDVVPSDVVAGLMLLRRCQKVMAKETLKDHTKNVLRFMSGRPVYAATRFLDLSQAKELANFRLALRCMKYALAAYGCPMLAYTGRVCCLLCDLNMCCCGGYHDQSASRDQQAAQFDCNSEDDVSDYSNCCLSSSFMPSRLFGCRSYRPEASIEALLKHRGISNDQFRLLYLCQELGIERTPFYVGTDYCLRSVIVAIRGTLSLQDVLTDLTADSETIPRVHNNSTNCDDEEWYGHRGMVRAAIYIQSTLAKRRLIEQAFEEDGCEKFQLLLTGHSLGAGIAAILGVLLRPIYGERLRVMAFSPPGGLLSLSACLYSKEFVTAVVVGKDVIPRVGLPQLESLRASLVRLISGCKRPKWSIIGSGLFVCCCCCCCRRGGCKFGICQSEHCDNDLINYASNADSVTVATPAVVAAETALMHRPLHLPGRILHLVREEKIEEAEYDNGTSIKDRLRLASRRLAFRVIESDYTDFDEVLVSPSMLQDHMADYVLDALQSVASKFDTANSDSNAADYYLLPEDCAIATSSELMSESLIVPCTVETVSEIAPSRQQTVVSFRTRRTPRSHTLPTRLTPSDLPMLAKGPMDSRLVSMATGQVKQTAPLATPESLSLASSRILLSSHLSVDNMADNHDDVDDDADGIDILDGVKDSDTLFGMPPLRHQLQRPLSLHENLSGYCYYLFPDEESGKQRPFDDIMPRPRIDFGRIAHAVGDRQRLLLQQQQQQQQQSQIIQSSLPHSVSSCETLIPPQTMIEQQQLTEESVFVVSAMVANGNDANEAVLRDGVDSIERTPQLLVRSTVLIGGKADGATSPLADRRVDYV